MTSKVYVLQETPIEFLASGGDVTFTMTSLGVDAGRQSDQHYFGAAARAFMFEWRFFCKFATTPIVNHVVGLYLKTSDGTHADNDDGTTDAALSHEDKLKNLTFLGELIVDEASSTPEFSTSGVISIASPYIQVVVWNGTDELFTATAADHGFILTPVTLQAQDT